jgi:hypothetical protein
MKKKDFLNAVRRQGEKFRADNIVITTDSGELHGNGIIEVGKGAFEIHVTLAESTRRPELPQGIKVRRDFWLIQGMIEEEIGFSVRSLPSNSSFNYNFGQPERSTLEFSANRMELTPTGFDCMTSRQIYEIQQQAKQQAGIVEAASSAVAAPVCTAPPANVLVTFRAVLPDFKLIERNAGTETKSNNDFLGESSRSTSDTFHGEMLGWTYGLIERDGDLHVYLTSKPERKSLGKDHDGRLLHAFLQALAFTHAQHAWPFSFEHRRNGKLVTDRIQLNEDVADSPHAPFTERLAFNNLTKDLTWKFGDVLELAYAFFSSDSKLARESENLLYIFREATANGIPKRITLLSLCSLLESIVRVIYEEEIAPKKAVETAEFQKAKKETCEELNKKNQPTYQRLAAILNNADPVNTRMRFDAVIEYLGLKPQDRWQELHGLWSKFRNPISHRMSKDNESEESYKEESLAESRIAGAINCMILKLMNYSGYVRLSAFEDKYGQI